MIADLFSIECWRRAWKEMECDLFHLSKHKTGHSGKPWTVGCLKCGREINICPY